MAFIEINARLSQDPAWTRIRRAKAPLAEHEKWAKISSKRHLLAID
mgnify:CR=1 FL=1